jgi:hypothetical protein
MTGDWAAILQEPETLMPGILVRGSGPEFFLDDLACLDQGKGHPSAEQSVTLRSRVSPGDDEVIKVCSVGVRRVRSTLAVTGTGL